MMPLGHLRRAMFFAALAGLGLCSTSSHAGRKKAPRPPEPEVVLPDASPGSVQERGYATDAEGVIMSRLGFVLRMYAYGMRRYIEDAAVAAATSPASVSAASLSVFTRQLEVATFALFEYTWEEDGRSHTRTYISRSNRGLDRFILRTTTDLQVPSHAEDHYLPDSDALHYAREPVPVPGSRVAPIQVGVTNREHDAEIKVLQLLTSEIQENPRMLGGTLVAFVSQQPCESCSPALRLFARENRANVRVNYVYGARGPERETALYRALRQARETAVALLLSRFTVQAGDG